MSPKTDPGPARVPLSKEAVLRAAIALADESGIDALSMRRLAEKVGVEAMSLYTHVKNKDEILDGIVDLVVSEIALPKGRDWKAAMRRRAISAHQVLLRHPWAAGLVESRMSLGGPGLRLCNAVLGELRQAGFPIELAYHAFLTLDSYIYGFTLQELSWPHAADQLPEAIAAVKPQISTREYPYLHEIMGYVLGSPKRAPVGPGSRGYDTDFEFGLDLILDALERARDEA